MKRTLIIVLNLISPFILYYLFVIIDFLLNGASNNSIILYEEYRYIWIVMFFLLGIIQSIYISKKINLDSKYKYVLILIIILLYLIIIYKYFLVMTQI